MKISAKIKFCFISLVAVAAVGCSEDEPGSTQDPAANAAAAQTPAPAATSLGQYREGLHFQVVKSSETEASPSRAIKVYFWYGCPHCSSLDAVLSEFAQSQGLPIEYEHAGIGLGWRKDAQAFYAVKHLGLMNSAIHQKIFELRQTQQADFSSTAGIQSLADLIQTDAATLTAAMNNETVLAQINKTNKILKDYQVSSVPVVVVADKYKVLTESIKTYDDYMQLIKGVYQQAR